MYRDWNRMAMSILLYERRWDVDANIRRQTNFGWGGIYDTLTGRGISGKHYLEQMATNRKRVRAVRARQIGLKRKGSLDHAAFKSAALWAVGIFVSPHWTPHRWYEMVFGCFAMPNQVCTGFTDSNSWSCQVLSQSLVVLQHPTQPEF